MGNRKIMAKYLQNAHVKENRRLRETVQELETKIKCLECDQQIAKSEAKMAKNSVKRAQPFLDRQTKKKKSNGS
jgi:outer membrane murein-binding lipoprotein Lpp